MNNQKPAYGNATRIDRLYFLDWLRVFVVLAVFVHHCSKFFDYQSNTIWNTERSVLLSMLREFNALWMMPLIFAISGAAVYYSLKSRKVSRFIKERVLRIVVPMFFIGTFIISPPQIYLIRVFNGQFSSGFFQWYPHYFDGIWPGGNFAPFGEGTHLWYLNYLFVFSLIVLPLFIQRRKTGKSIISGLSTFFEKPWALLLLFAPVSAASAFFEAIGLGSIRALGHWDPISYLLFFIYGYLIFSNTRIQRIIRKHSPTYLIVALVLTVLYLVSRFGFILKIPGLTRHDLLNDGALLPLNQSLWIAVQAFRGLLGWCWIIGLLGLGHRFLNFNNKFLTYANEAVLPFYILHHTVIYIIGFYVIQWSSNIGSKYLLISITSFTIIMVIYEILVRRINLLRFLFGMKLIKSGVNPNRSHKEIKLL